MNLASYTEHPLARLSAGRESMPPTTQDQTAADFPSRFVYTPRQKLKRALGYVLYPLKNKFDRPRVETRLRAIGAQIDGGTAVNSMSWGHRGFAIEIFLKRIARIVGTGTMETVVCFGCGSGAEMYTVARFLRPKRIIGYDFFNYKRAWDFVTVEVKARHNIQVEFRQLDLRNLIPNGAPRGDILLSFAVLEHLRDMDTTFEHLKPLVQNNGWFASQWGPMWYSYGGDHIASELGFDAGFEHVALNSEEYFSFYKRHPRNAKSIQDSVPTWLELGLSNFALYREYMSAIQKYFGPTRYLHWQLSPDAFEWREKFPVKWSQLLQSNPHIQPLDLVLQGAAILTSAR